MNINDFTVDFAELFEDVDESEITPATVFKEIEEWDSLLALAVIALAKTKYKKTIKGEEIRLCQTVEDLFNIIDAQ